MPGREDAQEDLCQPESIPRWSFRLCTLVPGMLFQSQDTPLKYTRTIETHCKIKYIWWNPCPAEKTPRRISASWNQSPGDRFFILGITLRHVVPISRHTIEIHKNHWKTLLNTRNLKTSMPSRQDTQEDLCQPESIPRWSLRLCTLVPGMLFQSQDTPLKYTGTIEKLSKIKEI